MSILYECEWERKYSDSKHPCGAEQNNLSSGYGIDWYYPRRVMESSMQYRHGMKLAKNQTNQCWFANTIGAEESQLGGEWNRQTDVLKQSGFLVSNGLIGEGHFIQLNHGSLVGHRGTDRHRELDRRVFLFNHGRCGTLSIVPTASIAIDSTNTNGLTNEREEVLPYIKSMLVITLLGQELSSFEILLEAHAVVLLLSRANHVLLTSRFLWISCGF